MVGIPFKLTPYFPESSNIVFITADCADDKDILQKLKEHLLAGKDVIMTSGFLKAMQGKGIEDLTSVRVTDKRFLQTYLPSKQKCVHFQSMYMVKKKY